MPSGDPERAPGKPDARLEELLDRLDGDLAELGVTKEQLRAHQEGLTLLPGEPPVTLPVAALGQQVNRMRRLTLLAAGLLVMSMLCAAITAVLVWPGGQRSTWSMDYAEAVTLLQQGDRPINDYMAAMKVAFQQIKTGVDLLRSMQGPDASPDLTAAAHRRLRALLRLIEQPGAQVAQPDFLDIGTVADLAADATVTEADRLVHLEHAADLTAYAMLLLRELVTEHTDMAQLKSVWLDKVSRLLRGD